MFGLSKGCRTCCRKQQNKIQPASRKSKREFFRRENTKCTFSSRRHLCFRLGRQAAQSPTLPGRLHIPFRHQPAKISRLHSAAAAANPSIAKCFFLQLRFSRRENTRCIFFQHPKPSFPAWPANISRCQSYYNLQQDNSFPSGTSQPTPPAAILFIPALTILNQPTSFLPAWPADALHSSPPFFQNPPIAIFPNILPAFAFPYLQLQSHPTTFSTPSTSSVLLPLFQTAAQTRNVVSRAGAACKAADGAGEEPAFFLSFLFFSPLFFPLFFSFPSPWRRGFAATPSFFFLLLFLFLFFPFCFFAFIFAFFFLLFSLYFSSDFLFLFFFVLSFYFFFLFTFAFIFVFFIFSICFFIFFTFAFFLFVFLFALFLSLLLSLFFVFLFVLLFYPPYSNLFPHYPTARRPFIFSIPPPIFPIPSSHFPAAAKMKKISAKESTGVRWPPGSERAAGGKTEGRNGAPRGMEKNVYYAGWNNGRKEMNGEKK